jgi:hypothetical protein
VHAYPGLLGVVIRFIKLKECKCTTLANGSGWQSFTDSISKFIHNLWLQGLVLFKLGIKLFKALILTYPREWMAYWFLLFIYTSCLYAQKSRGENPHGLLSYTKLNENPFHSSAPALAVVGQKGFW